MKRSENVIPIGHTPASMVVSPQSNVFHAVFRASDIFATNKQNIKPLILLFWRSAHFASFSMCQNVTNSSSLETFL